MEEAVTQQLQRQESSHSDPEKLQQAPTGASSKTNYIVTVSLRFTSEGEVKFIVNVTRLLATFMGYYPVDSVRVDRETDQTQTTHHSRRRLITYDAFADGERRRLKGSVIYNTRFFYETKEDAALALGQARGICNTTLPEQLAALGWESVLCDGFVIEHTLGAGCTVPIAEGGYFVVPSTLIGNPYSCAANTFLATGDICVFKEAATVSCSTTGAVACDFNSLTGKSEMLAPKCSAKREPDPSDNAILWPTVGVAGLFFFLWLYAMYETKKMMKSHKHLSKLEALQHILCSTYPLLKTFCLLSSSHVCQLPLFFHASVDLIAYTIFLWSFVLLDCNWFKIYRVRGKLRPGGEKLIKSYVVLVTILLLCSFALLIYTFGFGGNIDNFVSGQKVTDFAKVACNVLLVGCLFYDRKELIAAVRDIFMKDISPKLAMLMNLFVAILTLNTVFGLIAASMSSMAASPIFFAASQVVVCAQALCLIQMYHYNDIVHGFDITTVMTVRRAETKFMSKMKSNRAQSMRQVSAVTALQRPSRLSFAVCPADAGAPGESRPMTALISREVLDKIESDDSVVKERKRKLIKKDNALPPKAATAAPDRADSPSSSNGHQSPASNQSEKREFIEAEEVVTRMPRKKRILPSKSKQTTLILASEAPSRSPRARGENENAARS